MAEKSFGRLNTFLQFLSRTYTKSRQDVSHVASCNQSYSYLIEVRRQSCPEKDLMWSETGIFLSGWCRRRWVAESSWSLTV